MMTGKETLLLNRACSRKSMSNPFWRFGGAALLLAMAATLTAQSQGNTAGAAFGLNVRNFGAVGDCQHDDTGALQSAVNQVNGRTLLLPTGCYLISQPIKIPFAQGFRILGEGRVGTKIQQQSDNTPILVFTQELTWGWEVSNLEFAWTRAQPSQNSNAVAILFSGPGGRGGMFNFTITHVTFDNGFRGIYLAPGTSGVPTVWGFVLEDIIAEKQMSGSTINLSPSPVAGMPRCILRDIHSSQTSAEPQIKLNHCTSGTLDGIEDNSGIDTSLDLTSCDAMSVRSLHFEVHHMAHANRPVIAAENSNIDFEGISAYLLSDVPGPNYLISNVAGGGMLSLRNVILRGTSATTNNSSNSQTYLLRLNGPVKLTEVKGMNLIRAEMNSSDDSSTATKVAELGKSPQ